MTDRNFLGPYALLYSVRKDVTLRKCCGLCSTVQHDTVHVRRFSLELWSFRNTVLYVSKALVLDCWSLPKFVSVRVIRKVQLRMSDEGYDERQLRKFKCLVSVTLFTVHIPYVEKKDFVIDTYMQNKEPTLSCALRQTGTWMVQKEQERGLPLVYQ